jgi:hypothetical protein
MCFSATASISSGIVIGAIGVATLPLVRRRRELMFAALPLAFGVHQILEGIIWNQLDESVEHAVRGPAVLAWLLFAWLLLPIWVPVSVWLLEPDPRRRRWMLGLGAIGAAVGVLLFAQAIAAPATASVLQNHLHYETPNGPPWLIAFPYVGATCLPLLLCTQRFVVWFGVAMTLSMAGSAALDAASFASVWCSFAAVLSVGLFAHYLLRDVALGGRATRELGAPAA